MEEKLKIQPKKSAIQSKGSKQQTQQESELTSPLASILAMLTAAEVAQSAQLCETIAWEAVGAVGNQAMLTALDSDPEPEGHAALVASILENAEIPFFDEASPLNMLKPTAAWEPVNVPPFAFSGAEPVGFAQIEQMAVDVTR